MTHDNDDLTPNLEAMFDRASKLERAGDRQTALEIYEALAVELKGTQHAQYVRNCIDHLKQLQDMASDADAQTTHEPQCPKCDGQMAQGFIPDHIPGGRFVGAWHEGQPEKSFWVHTKASDSGGLPIGAFRCKACGYLELYAHNRFAAL